MAQVDSKYIGLIENDLKCAGITHDSYYGEVVIKFQDGKICNIQRKESLKVEQSK